MKSKGPKEQKFALVFERVFAITIVCCIGFGPVGCVRRRMEVRTNPPGATVSVDNQVIGTTPAASPFIHYGTREFRIEKDGYRTEVIRRNIRPPWYQWPGVDFVAETLWPGELRDNRIVDVQMVPDAMESSDDVLQRAESLRNQARNGSL